MAEKKAVEAVEAESAAVFTKAQLIASAKYASRKDLIGALLDDNKTYTCEQVDGLIKKFMKGKVV